jgi:hypothetical protein
MSLTVPHDGITVLEIQRLAGAAGIRLERVDVREAKDRPEHDRIDLVVANADPALVTALTDTLRGRPGIASVRASILPSRARNGVREKLPG